MVNTGPDGTRASNPDGDVTLFVADLNDLIAVNTDASSNLTMFQFELPALSEVPVNVRVTATNAGGSGQPSAWSAPVHKICRDNEYLTVQVSTNGWTCQPCDSIATSCDGGSSFGVAARPGHFRLPWVPGRLGFIECPRPESCLSSQVGPAANFTRLPQGSAVA